MINLKSLKSFCIMLSVCSILISIGCSSNKTNNKVKQSINTNSSNEGDTPPVAVNDNYIGTWMDINHDPTDTSETFIVTKIHDYQYQVGSLTGDLKQVVDGTQYLSVWTTEGAEMQFIFDNYTKHLILRTPFFSKELRKIN